MTICFGSGLGASLTESVHGRLPPRSFWRGARFSLHLPTFEAVGSGHLGPAKRKILFWPDVKLIPQTNKQFLPLTSSLLVDEVSLFTVASVIGAEASKKKRSY